MSLTLTLRERPVQPVDCSALTPEALGGRSPAEVAALELPSGNRRLRVDSLFTVAGKPGGDLEIRGATDRLDRIGAGMTQGRISIQGDAGSYLGVGMTGGAIELSGNAGAFAASGMSGGLLQIAGNAGDF